MATYSTGITVTWGGVDFLEVQELSWTYGGSRTGRDTEWTGEQGNVTIACLGFNNTNISNFGSRELLEISGGGSTLTTYAAWESVAVTYERNGVTRHTVTLRILDN